MEDLTTTGASSENSLKFNPDLYSDLIKVSFETQQSIIKQALNGYQSKSQNRNQAHNNAKRAGFRFHCNLCDDNVVYRAPSNIQVKFDQYSKLTPKDMEDALFQRDSAVYETHGKLMKIVKREQNLFEEFMKTLHPKFTATKLSLPQGWFDFKHQQHGNFYRKHFSDKKHNYRVNTTHILTHVISTNTPKYIEQFGQILAYGSRYRLKLPKVGHLIKNNIHSLSHNSKPQLISENKKTDKCLTKQQSVTKTANLHSIETCADNISNNQPNSDQVLISSCTITQSSDSQLISSPIVTCSDITSDNMSVLTSIAMCPPENSELSENEVISDTHVICCAHESSEMRNSQESSVAIMECFDTSDNKLSIPKTSEGYKNQVISTSIDTSKEKSPDNEPISSKSEHEKNHSTESDMEESCNTTKQLPILYKHVHIAVSQDLDVFVTDVPITKLGANINSELTHDDVIDFLQGLKVAEIIADVESLCLVFSALPPEFYQPFLFRVSVQQQEDGSKYCKISHPLPTDQSTPEIIKQEVMNEFLFKSSSQKTFDSYDDANIQFMEYINDCGANLIDKGSEGKDPKDELSGHFEPMKFTSFLDWTNLNSNTIADRVYSLFACGDTNFVVYSKPPLITKFCGMYEKTAIYVKTQNFYEYGLEIVKPSEYAYVYLKALLTNCVGVIIVHVEMSSYHIVAFEERSVNELHDFFPASESMGRLNTLFESIKNLNEGNFIYNHDISKRHSVIYEELNNAHVQADFSLSQYKEFKLVTPDVPAVEFHKTELTAWQRHNARLPMCFNPRKAGTYLCHEYLGRESCSKANTCAFAHLNKKQLEHEVGKCEYQKFMKSFERPKEERLGKKKAGASANPGFGRIKRPKRKQRKK